MESNSSEIPKESIALASIPNWSKPEHLAGTEQIIILKLKFAIHIYSILET
jgi:hypothetical protein